jgi:pimeloyl-[acyl-carrier protein] synthase
MVRIAASDFDWYDKRIEKGDIIYLMLDAANHDPRVWEDPEAFNAERENRANVIFGAGIHNCLGQHVAKLELTEFFSAIFRRFPTLKVVSTEYDYLPSYVIRGVERLSVRFC